MLRLLDSLPLLSTTLHPHDWKLITGEGEGGIGQRAVKGGEGGECQDSPILFSSNAIEL